MPLEFLGFWGGSEGAHAQFLQNHQRLREAKYWAEATTCSLSPSAGLPSLSFPHFGSVSMIKSAILSRLDQLASSGHSKSHTTAKYETNYVYNN